VISGREFTIKEIHAYWKFKHLILGAFSFCFRTLSITSKEK
jgi:hypothetical protein